MPALLINIKIDDEIKFELLKVTLADLRGLFNECHVKFRGIYSDKCLEFAKQILDKSESLAFYQELQEEDWVAATLNMLGNVKSRSLFLYFEDHKLVSTRAHLESVLIDFDKYNLDYLCYSWFKASVLGIENLLPLNPVKTDLFHIIQYSQKNNSIIGGISPNYCASSLVGMYSAAYFKSLLSTSNAKRKIYSGVFSAVISRLLPHPRCRKLLYRVNQYLSPLGLRFCIWPKATPFNIEHIWFETVFCHRPWIFGILTTELFANYDDDNGAYKESLIKRGIYPFQTRVEQNQDLKQAPQINFRVHLKDGELYDCTYFSRRGRIRKPPVVHILVEAGKVIVACQSLETTLENSSGEYFYTNKKPVVRSIGNSIITLSIFDEGF